MADMTRGFMVPEQPTTPTVRGGLAPEERGGLSKFMGDVERGLNMVMSNPLYARAWSGMVSGQAQDPTAGPNALAQIQQQNAGPSIQDELNAYRLRQMQRTEQEAEDSARRRAALAQAVGSGDQRSVRSAFAEFAPDKVAEQMFAPPKAPSLKAVMTPEGPKYVPVEEASGMTPFSPGLVNIHNAPSGLDPNQVATASRAERASFMASMAPFEAFDRAKTTMRNVRGMADEKGILPQQASQIIASDAMAALRPEALNEGDVARLTAVGLWNKINAAIGLPPQMTVEQLDTLSKMIEDKAREAEPKRKALIEDGRFRAQTFQFDPRLILGEYTDWKPVGAQVSPTSAPTPVRARPLP